MQQRYLNHKMDNAPLFCSLANTRFQIILIAQSPPSFSLQTEIIGRERNVVQQRQLFKSSWLVAAVSTTLSLIWMDP